MLDPDLSPTPPGACGELYVAGPALARGYHRRAVDEAVAFLSHPRLRPGERMYRTGDLVRRTADGTLCLVGRRDRTVSIRGGPRLPVPCCCVPTLSGTWAGRRPPLDERSRWCWFRFFLETEKQWVAEKAGKTLRDSWD